MKLTIDDKEYDIEDEVSDLVLLISRERDKYRAALQELSVLGNGGVRGNSDGNVIAQEALDSFSS